MGHPQVAGVGNNTSAMLTLHKAPLRGPRVEEQRGGCVVTNPYHLGVARQEVQDPVAEGGVYSQNP